MKKTTGCVGSARTGTYSAEFITNGRRRWINFDKCQSQYHFKCIPKRHLNNFGLEECEENNNELAFICHFCTTDIDSSCEEFELDESDEDD